MTNLLSCIALHCDLVCVNFPHCISRATSPSRILPLNWPQIEIFKVKKLIKNLQAARGNGTSMISLIIPPGDQISRVNKMLSDE